MSSQYFTLLLCDFDGLCLLHLVFVLQLTSVLVGLYEAPDRPSNAIEYESHRLF